MFICGLSTPRFVRLCARDSAELQPICENRCVSGMEGYAPEDESAARHLNLTALVDRNVAAFWRSEVYPPRPRDFLLGVEQHFYPLRNPASRAGNREEHREHRHRESHGLIDQPRVEIHVRIELARDEIIVLERDSFAFERDVNH